MIGVFLQARMESSRLPGKVLLRLGDKTVIEHAMSALKRSHADTYMLLTDANSAEDLRPAAEQEGFGVFCGPEEDVLRRYAMAIEETGVDRVVRATGDNPLVSAHLIDELMKLHREEKADFSGFMGMPLGTGVEIVESRVLLTADKEAQEQYEREHVSPFIYFRPQRFRVFRPTVPKAFRLPDARVTLDTADDFQRLREIYRQLYRGEPIEIDALVPFMRTFCEPAGIYS